MGTNTNTSGPSTLAMPTLSNQFGIFDILQPHFPHLGSQSFLAWSTSNYATLVCLLGLLAFLRNYISQLESWLKEHFTSTVYVKQTDETYDMLLFWVVSHGLDKTARSSIARVGTRTRSGHQKSPESEDKKPLRFAPWNGGFFFWFRNRLLSYRTELKDVGFNKEEEISITCFGRSSQVLKDLLEECRAEYLNQIENKTTIFENHGDSWTKVATREIRPLSTVIVSEKQKKHLIEDLKSFLDPETRRWFAKRAIPYRRGYLLYGPPGTGKSSFSLSMAGELDLDVYIVNISSVNDQTLKGLFSKLPPKCVILLEDIDAVGTARASQLNQEKSVHEPLGPMWPGTLSGLLNTIDGVASQEGRVLIMTTNHIEKLDEALIRPGRVDIKTEFQLADASMTTHLFDFMFKQDAPDAKNGSKEENDRLAGRFAAMVPEKEFSPAEVISYLLRHRHSPTAAVKYAEEWITAARRERGLERRLGK